MRRNHRLTRRHWLHIRNLSAVGFITMMMMAVFAAQDTVDLTRLPVGDGQNSDQPTVGRVWVCPRRGGPGGPIGGAHQQGPWFNGDGTFDFTAKIIVDGVVEWPSERMIITDGDSRLITGNSLPDHPTGTYPIARTDDAYAYDRNPNTIREQDILLTLTTHPQVAPAPGCLSMGPIAISLSGVVIFNALDAEERDAVAWETQDSCQGHPEITGQYHYHNLSTCLIAALEPQPEGEHSPLMAYALDGFGLYGHHGEAGALLTNADLDECHGHTHTIEWEGVWIEMYHYHATHEYPYTIGCFRGEPAQLPPNRPPPPRP
jgi:hypothetical protein